MDEFQRTVARNMLASVRSVLTDVTAMTREEWLRDDQAKWRVAQAIVVLGAGSTRLLWFPAQYKDAWWWRAERLGFGLTVGKSQLDGSYLWKAIHRDWPDVARKLQQMLDDDPEPEPHGR